MTIDEFNALEPDAAIAFLLTTARVASWADAVAAARPYESAEALIVTAREFAADWGAAEVDEALSAHPRIGEAPTGDDVDAAHSRKEQSAMSGADPTIAAGIADGNAAYERTFGRVFLIRAAGRTPEEILAVLRLRLRNDPATETLVVAGELLDIAELRLRQALIPIDGRTVVTRSHVTTHVLDTTSGKPADGVAVELLGPDGPIASGSTDADGRVESLGPDTLPAGTYELRLHTGEWFDRHGVEAFHPVIAINFRVGPDPAVHWHIPVLLSPFAFTTYRGS